MLENEFNSIIANQDKISGRIRAKDIDMIAYKILKLTEVLPEHGRIVYQYMPKEVKQKINLLVDDVLKIPAIKKEYDKYIKYVNNLSKGYSASEKHTDYTEDKNIEDIRKRIANQILKTCDKARSISDIIDKVTDEVDLTGSEEPNVEDEFVFPDYDISENDDNIKNTDFKMEWNQEYKSAIKNLYDPNIENMEHILNILEQQASNGNVLAIYELGKIYDRGIKIEKNPDIAKKYYTDAFKGFQYLKNIPSETPRKTEWKKSYCNYRLGKMYESGIGTEQDQKKAIECYKMSSNKYAKYSLASMYLRHMGVEITEDNEERYYCSALELLKESADQKNYYAAYSLSENSEKRNRLNLSDEDIQKYYKNAFTGFKQMLDEAENDFLLYRLGTMYYNGKGVEKDTEKAFDCFSRSAKMNNPNALYAMGKYFHIQGKKNNYEALTVILATGVDVTKPYAGEYENLGRGVSYCATCDAALYKEREAIVIGFNEEALSEAEFLAQTAKKVYYMPLYNKDKDINTLQAGKDSLKDNIDII